MQNVLVAGKDMREYRIQATYRLVSIARKSDRRACEFKITSLITETAGQTGLDPNGSKQIHAAVTEALVNMSGYDDDCSIREPFLSVFETVPEGDLI
jgi:hypothetical protein